MFTPSEIAVGESVHAFDYVIVLLSFVYAAAVTHILATVGDLITAGRRVKVSWLNLGWMAGALLSALSWWMATWELRQVRTWDFLFIALNFGMACVLYVLVRLTCPRVASEGEIDLPAFHRDQGPTYMWSAAGFGVAGMLYNAAYDLSTNGSYFLRQDIPILPMVVAAAVAAVFVRRPLVQAICLLIEFAAWGVYFAAFETSLTG